jgi:hypothetical protein
VLQNYVSISVVFSPANNFNWKITLHLMAEPRNSQQQWKWWFK